MQDNHVKHYGRRPTHFIAARVSHSEPLLKAVETVQQALTEHDPALQGALVEPITAHLTLMVLPCRHHLGNIPTKTFYVQDTAHVCRHVS